MQRLAFTFVAVYLSLAVSPTLFAAKPQAIPVDGPPFDAVLVASDVQWNFRFTSGEKTRDLPATDLATWGSFPEATRGPQLLLSGGGVLVAGIVALDREQLTAQADLAGEVKLPLAKLAGIMFHPPHDRYRRDQLAEQIRTTSGDTDRMILDNGDELTGTIAALNEETIALETAAGKVDVDVSRIAALVFNPALADKPPAAGLRAIVGLRDGSRLIARSLVTTEAEARIALSGGVELKTKPADVVALQPLGGRAVYLSDLPAAGYRHIPFLSLAWPYRANRNVLGSQLRSGGKLHLKGLGVHSASRLTYDLDQSYTKLQAELGIDDQAGGRGSVVFRVFVDSGDGSWESKYTSPVIRGGDPPVAMSVDLTGVKRISLLVDFADHGDELDYANWLNIRAVK